MNDCWQVCSLRELHRNFQVQLDKIQGYGWLGLGLRVRFGFFADGYYRISYYYTVQLYWNGLLPDCSHALHVPIVIIFCWWVHTHLITDTLWTFYIKNIAFLKILEIIVRVWNNLPDSVDFSTLVSFTLTIKTVEFSKYLSLRYSYQFTILSVFFLLVSAFYCF